jgi:Fic family protein
MATADSIARMEPMMPEEGERRLQDLAVDLVAKANALAGRIHPIVRRSVGALVRSMNCYYSNLIEGHDTHPRDIDRALARDYAADPQRRALQLEAVAHIEVQRMIDLGEDPPAWPATADYAVWLHREFCTRLPEELLWVESPDTHERLKVEPGVLRSRDVQVGLHVPPEGASLSRFLTRFAEAYDPRNLSKVRQIEAIAAAHHRFLWIHPFLDGNGRVARLMSHALLKRLGVGSSLWSASRGLARNVQRYKALLMAADERRRGDLDGRGTLSQAALVEFCRFFLATCVDQVEYMTSILEPAELLRRIEHYVEDETRAGRMPRGAFAILREALLAGEVERGRAPELTGYRERMARVVVSRLLELGLLNSEGPRSPLRSGFPIDVVERWFPRLYPAV